MHNKRINTLIHVLKVIYNYIITILVQHTHTHTYITEDKIQGGGRKFLGHFERHFESPIIIYINKTASYLMNESKICNKNLFYYTVKVEIAVHDQLFCRHQHRGSLHGVTRKLHLDQKSMSHKRIERQM